MMRQNKNLNLWKAYSTLIFALLTVMFSLQFAVAAANLEVTAFSCSPDEVILNGQFSCTATVENTGDATGTLNTATLYPDENNWLEDTSYAETVNTNIDSGSSLDVAFDGLKGKKSGNNGFDRIILDQVSDTFVSDSGATVNVIDVAVTEDGPSSATASSTFDVTAQATAGGDMDLELTFSVSSGGCSIGNQESSITTTDLTDGQTTAHTWTVTMGTSTCRYSLGAEATSNPAGIASKTDSLSNSVSCSGSSCSSGGGDSGSSGGSTATGGGGAAAVKKEEVKSEEVVSGETENKEREISKEKVIEVAKTIGKLLVIVVAAGAVMVLVIFAYLAIKFKEYSLSKLRRIATDKFFRRGFKEHFN